MGNSNLTEILEILENSNKWTANWIDGGYRKFIYVPETTQRYTTLYIPLTIDSQPDLTSDFVGRILTEKYILVTVHFNPKGKTWNQFLVWLKTMITNPDSLLDV